MTRTLEMGATPGATGVRFRVWAPHAQKVFVTGTFNDWSPDATPLTVDNAGCWAAEVPAAAVGHEYRYLIQGPQGPVSRIDPYARQVTHSAGNGIICDPRAFDWGDDSFRIAAGNELVLYELHVGTFNATRDGHPGTLDSAVERLPDLQRLGINAIELMPLAEFPGDFSWGYNPAHPFTVESAYGGPDALRRFVKAAHGHGIAVIVDIVFNHLGPADLGLWQFDGWSEGGMGGIYFYNDRRAHTPWGDTRPDYSRDEVRAYLRDNAMMWLDEYHADGLRWDMVAYIKSVDGSIDDPANDLPEGRSLLQWINTETGQRFPGRIRIGESMRDDPWVTRAIDAGGAGFDAQWDAQFVHSVRQAVIAPDDQRRDLDSVRRAIEHRSEPDAFRRVIFTESHDEVANGHARVPEEIWPGNVGSWFSRKRSTLAGALVLVSPGIPMLFQGQEFLEDRWFQDRDPIDWSRAEEERGILAMYQALIALRRNRSGVTGGLCGRNVAVHHVDDAAKVLAFHRWERPGPTDSVVVVVNLANRVVDGTRIGFPRAGTWKTRFNSDSDAYGADFANHPAPDVEAGGEGADGLPSSGMVGIGPYTVLILSQDG
jgi:1,4-alpha-glucan branching enzyme